MPRERDDETGMYEKAYPPHDFISTIESLGEQATTSNILESLGCSRRTALNMLHELENENRVDSVKVGNSYLWRIKENE
jgi:Mn-dependent DtxR family transcriptional regulator